MEFRSHGGYCCGRRHMYGMDGQSSADIRLMLERNGALNGVDIVLDEDEGGGLLTEIVLSDGENDAATYAAVREAGFVEVLTWLNSNSRNTCTMFVYAPPEADLSFNAAPVQVRERVVNAPAVPVPVVASTYHNVLAGGRSNAGWLTREQAAEAAPRARSIDRRDVYSDGTVRHVVGV